MKERKYKKREQQEFLKRKIERQEIRKKAIGEYFVEFTTYFRPWLHELTRQYKEKGHFPLMACWLLPSYYEDDLDKEIAVFASILIKDDDKVLEHVEAFRHLIGDSPYMWFVQRMFVSLSIGDTQFQRTGGVINQRIAEYFAAIYDNWSNRVSAVNLIMLKTFSDKDYIDKANMLRLVLSTSDGFGLGLWKANPLKLKCPITRDVRDLLRTFFHDYTRLHDVNDAIHLFGFERDYDFFYAAFAYKELQKRNPKGCSRLATLYQKRYNECNFLVRTNWDTDKRDGILPEIDLND